jgi:hypothetical protein
VERDVVEQEIDVVVLAADIEVVLAADEREALAHLHEEIPDPFDELGFEMPLVGVMCERHEIKDIGVLEGGGDHVGVRWWEGGGEVVEGFPFALVQAGVDMGTASSLGSCGAFIRYGVTHESDPEATPTDRSIAQNLAW